MNSHLLETPIEEMMNEELQQLQDLAKRLVSDNWRPPTEADADKDGFVDVQMVHGKWEPMHWTVASTRQGVWVVWRPRKPVKQREFALVRQWAENPGEFVIGDALIGQLRDLLETYDKMTAPPECIKDEPAVRERREV